MRQLGIEHVTWGDHFLFASAVPLNGFHWSDNLTPIAQHSEREESNAFHAGKLTGPWLTRPLSPDEIAGRSREVGPLNEHRTSARGLHRDFAQLDPEPEAIRRFANRYGSLGHGVWLKSGPNAAMQYGEGFAYWTRQIAKMASLTRAWDLARDGHAKTLRDYVTVSWELEAGIRRWLEVTIPGWQPWLSGDRYFFRLWKTGDPIEPVKYVVQVMVNEYMAAYVRPGLLPLAGSIIRDVPDCLLGALYASFAVEIAGISPSARECAAPDCTRVVIPGKGHGRYCSKRCQMRIYMREKRDRERREKRDSVREVSDGEA